MKEQTFSNGYIVALLVLILLTNAFCFRAESERFGILQTKIDNFTLINQTIERIEEKLKNTNDATLPEIQAEIDKLKEALKIQNRYR